jgi:hypothetical protein
VIALGLALTWVAGVSFAFGEHVLPKHVAPFAAAPMLWLLDITVNILDTPQRALVADLASDEQQIPMQVVIVCMKGIGTLAGFSILSVYDVPAEHMLELVVLLCSINTVAVLLQFVVAKETPLTDISQDTAGARNRLLTPVSDAIEAARGSSSLFRRLAAVQCLIALGGSAWGLYGGQWFGICVYQGSQSAPSGSPAHEAYAAGLRQFAHAGQSKSIVLLASSLLVICVLRRTEARPLAIYTVMIFAGAVASSTAALLVGHNGTLAILCVTFSVLPYAGAHAIPFGLVARLGKRAEEQGGHVSVAVQMALLNCASTLGMQICTVCLAAIEGSVSLVRALPLIYLVAAAAEFLASLGALATDRVLEDQVEYSHPEEHGAKHDMEESMLAET